jgi:hypothetical protein
MFDTFSLVSETTERFSTPRTNICMFLITTTDNDQHDKLQRPAAPPVDNGDATTPPFSAPSRTPVPVAAPTAAPRGIQTLFPTVDTNQPTFETARAFITVATSFPSSTAAVTVRASIVDALKSEEIQTRDGSTSDAPSFVPSDVPSWVPSTVPTIPSIPVTPKASFSGPSPAPTEFERVPRVPFVISTPSPSPTEQAQLVPQESTLWLTADPVNLQAVGAVDVSSIREPFFQHVETLMKPYMMKHVGEILKNFKLNIAFLPAKSRSVSVGVTGSQAMKLSYFDVLVDMEISSESANDLNLFQDEQATAAVASFFRGMSVNALITSLNQGGIPIDAILHAELSMEAHLANMYSSELSDPFENIRVNDPPDTLKSETNNDDESDKSAALYVALVSGGCVLAAVMLAILYNRRRNRRFQIHYPGDSEEGSLFTNSDASTIKPAAITLRNKSVDDNSVISGMSAMYPQSASKTPGFPLIPARMQFGPDLAGEEKEDLEHAMVPVNGNQNYTATSALTCLDGAQTIDGLSNQYPEFDLYSSMPARPAFSIDGITIPFSYSVDDEDYQKERKRWHDEADDLALIVIPDGPASVEGNERMDYFNDDEESNLENEI